jgi:hypothetical protein
MNEIDFTIPREINVVSFDISGVKIDLYEGATIYVEFKCDDGSTIYQEVILREKAYTQWGDVDEYIAKMSQPLWLKNLIIIATTLNI